MSSANAFRYPLWCRGDLDGFFGLMVDNLVQVLLIIAFCTYVAGMPDTVVYTRVLPGVALSLLIGNIFYGLQAHYSARKHNNPTCTALPFGINTPSVIAYAIFIMGPVYRLYEPTLGAGPASDLAWKAGLLACLVSGIIEFTGAFYAEYLRRITPRAALLGVLAALGIAFIAADFAFRIYTSPLVGLLPLACLLLAYFAHYKFPLGLPGGFLAVLFGTAIAWLLSATGWHVEGAATRSVAAVQGALHQVRWIAPQFCGGELWSVLTDPKHPDLLLSFLTVSIPMGIINVIGSLQNIESAEAGGDRFRTGPSLAVNGLGTIAAGLFGSCFPTTIYIGHPGWKALGARSGYSILNGLFFTVFFLFGLGPLLTALIPIEAGAAIVLYIGIIITAQAFQATPREHAPAVAIALFPALGAFVVVALGNYFDVAGMGVAGAKTLMDLISSPDSRVLYLPGLLTLTGANSGWIVVTLILAAIGAALIDHKYKAAAIWAGVGAVLTCVGLLHAYRLEGNTLHELFIWQPAPRAALFTPVLNGPATAQPATAAATSSATPPSLYYRGISIAIGYALATILFALVAIRAKKLAAAAAPPMPEALESLSVQPEPPSSPPSP